ncbi:MAG TPA: uroporphyrinogen decarboxylase family protein [Tepidisphaeraceae bacterium]|nr:uroporphyrinogen decarboxylase family protein [Tepidisphaeraceae bacterium]
MSMTSRQRVLSAVNHVQPDRVPIDFGGHRSSGIMAIAYRKLREHLGLPERLPRVYDMIQQLAIIDEDVLHRFGVDTIELGRGFCQEDRYWKPWQLPDGSDCLIPAWVDVRKSGEDWIIHSPTGRPVGIQKAGSLYFEQTYWPFIEGMPSDLSCLPEALAEVSWSVPTPPGPGADLAAGAKAFRESTDRAIIGLFGGNLLETGQMLFRNDNFFMLLAGEPQEAHRFLDRLVEMHLANLEKYLSAVGPYIDIILFGDDLGMQTGPQMSPRMYHEFFYPRHRAMWQRVKELSKAKIMLHCCGGVRELLNDLIDAGLDTINPVQITCSGMEASGLKRDFGSRLCFWGGACDTREILPKGTRAEVRRHVLHQLKTLSPGGGFVFQQVHNVMADVPPENIVAMFDAVGVFNNR